ncbi:MAG: T9SS C-terminal target domain-containing protein [Cytophagia bacterium]|nr:T9SS C-terminal target domain-containing protein [Cytophagia bacterium]NBW34404.1 T9SS C-terminal target domain-containing protein [Cytophagia bacterium]
MLIIFRILFFLSISLSAIAQEIRLMKSAISTSAIGTSGFRSGAVSINYTIGQSSSIKHFNAGQIHLLQGFQHPQLPRDFAYHEGAETLSIYPNPSPGLISIRWYDAIESEWVWLDVVDLYGKIVLKTLVERKGQVVQFDASSLPRATYILQLNGSVSGHATHTLILI